MKKSRPRFWTEKKILVEVIGPDGHIESCLETPFALVGSHAQSDIVLKGKGIGRRHFYVQIIDDALFCVTLSREKTPCRHRGRWLKPDEKITVGDYDLKFGLVGEKVTATTDAPNPLKHSVNSPHPRISCWAETKHLGDYPLRKQLSIVGRCKACALQLSTRTVSWEHCVLFRQDKSTWVIGLHSQIPVTQNGNEVHCKRLKDRVTLKVGRVQLRFRMNQESTSRVSDLHSVSHPIESEGHRENELSNHFEEQKQFQSALQLLENDQEQLAKDRKQLNSDQEQLKSEQQRLDDLQAQVKNAQLQLAADKEQLDGERQQLSNELEQLEKDREQLDSDQEQLNAEQKREGDLQDQAEKAQQQLAADKELLDSERQQLDSDQEQLENDRQKLNADQEQLDAEQKRLGILQDQVENAQQQLAADKELLDSERQQLNSDREQLQADQLRLGNLQEQNQNTQQLSGDQEKLEKDRQQLNSEQEQVQAEQQRLGRLQSQLQDAQQQLAADQLQLEQDQLQLASQVQQLNLQESAIAARQLELDGLAAKVNEIRKNTDDQTKQETQAFEERIASTNRELERTKKEKEEIQQQLQQLELAGTAFAEEKNQLQQRLETAQSERLTSEKETQELKQMIRDIGLSSKDELGTPPITATSDLETLKKWLQGLVAQLQSTPANNQDLAIQDTPLRTDQRLTTQQIQNDVAEESVETKKKEMERISEIDETQQKLLTRLRQHKKKSIFGRLFGWFQGTDL